MSHWAFKVSNCSLHKQKLTTKCTDDHLTPHEHNLAEDKKPTQTHTERHTNRTSHFLPSRPCRLTLCPLTDYGATPRHKKRPAAKHNKRNETQKSVLTHLSIHVSFCRKRPGPLLRECGHPCPSQVAAEFQVRLHFSLVHRVALDAPPHPRRSARLKKKHGTTWIEIVTASFSQG